MGRYTVKRLIQSIVVVLAVSTLAFVILRGVGDPARLLLSPEGTREDLSTLRRVLGLDVPLYVQYVRFLGGIVRGDFGTSFTFGLPAFELVLQRMPATLLLTGAALAIAVPMGLVLGIISAVKQNTVYDNLATTLAVLGRATPNFWLAIMLILLFGVILRWLPPSGYGSLSHLIMPAIALGTGLAATIARLTRSSMLEVIRQDYVRTARAKGLRERNVLFRHAFRNALIPVITVVGLQTGTLLGGAIITETIFAWPGAGRLLVQSIYNYDYPVVQTSVFIIAATFVLINLVIDLLYGSIDPRIRYE